MGILNRIIRRMTRTSPPPARLQKLVALAYEAAGQGRRAESWNAPAAGPERAGIYELQTLRNRARAMVRNGGYATAGIDRLETNTIGTGITPRPCIDDPAIKSGLQTLWDEWITEADAAGLLDFYGLQSLVARTVFEAGECFVRLRYRRLEDGLSVPLQLQVLEPEFVPLDKYETNGGNRIRAGIEFDGIGRRVAYWMYPRHPNDDCEGLNMPVRVPAEQVLHVFIPIRPGQLRGIPALAPTMTRMRTLDEFDDANLFRQEIANLFAGFVRKPVPEAAYDPEAGEAEEEERPLLAMEPGTMQELAPGEEVEFSSPPGAGDNYGPFMRQQLMAIAADLGIPYEILTGDLREVNDRLIRVALNEFRRRIEKLQFSVFVQQLCRPVRAAWLDAAVLAGAISLPAYRTRRAEYLKTRWSPQGWAYIHPVQDVQAITAKIKAGLTSRSEAVLRDGYDVEMIDAENAADHAREKALGLTYETAVPPPKAQDGEEVK